VNKKVCAVERREALCVDMILEGGSIEVDGQGTLITTEECLLHPSRNPDMSKVVCGRRLATPWGVQALWHRCRCQL
jgi:agmatine deiminase